MRNLLGAKAAEVVVRGDDHPVAPHHYRQGGFVLNPDGVPFHPRHRIDFLKVLPDDIDLEPVLDGVTVISADDPVQVGDLYTIWVDQLNDRESQVYQVLCDDRTEPPDAYDGDGLVGHDPTHGVEA